jgi:LysM repeat protein
VRYFPTICIALSLTGCAANYSPCVSESSVPTSSIQDRLTATKAAEGSLYEIEIYVIAPGDTLNAISKKFNCPLKELERLNPGLGETQVGQHIRVSERVIAVDLFNSTSFDALCRWKASQRAANGN